MLITDQVATAPCTDRIRANVRLSKQSEYRLHSRIQAQLLTRKKISERVRNKNLLRPVISLEVQQLPQSVFERSEAAFHNQAGDHMRPFISNTSLSHCLALSFLFPNNPEGDFHVQ